MGTVVDEIVKQTGGDDDENSSETPLQCAGAPREELLIVFAHFHPYNTFGRSGHWA
jgi:hypothetical protein